MPAAVAIPLVTGLATAGATATGAVLSSRANNRATKANAAANDKATALATSQEDTRRREFDQQQAELKRQFDINESNKAPYRAASQGALLQLSDLLGIPGLGAGGGSSAPMARPTSSGEAWSADFIKKNLAETGQDPNTFQYWLDKEGELKAREAERNEPGYALWRLRDPNSGKGGATMPRAAATPTSAPVTAPNAISAPVPFRALYDPRMRA